MISNLPYNYSSIVPASYIINNDNTKINAVNCNTGVIDFSGNDASIVIQNAINNLTANRSWKEKIIIKGNYTINSTIKVPSYIILEICGKLTLGSDINLIESNSLTSWSQYVEILSGSLDGTGHSNYHGIYGVFDDSIIAYNTIQNFNHGIELNGSSWADSGIHRSGGTLITFNHIVNNNIGIYYQGYASDNKASFNTIGQSTTYGIYIQTSSIILIGNQIWSNINGHDANIYLESTSDFGVDLIIITANFIDGSKKNGIVAHANTNNITNLIITNNLFQKIGLLTNNTYDCILFKREGSETCGISVISGNRFVSYESSKPRYGINELDSSYNQISDNRFTGMISNAILPGTNSIINNNLGYKTNNNILSSGLSITSTTILTYTFPHELDITPNKQNCHLTVIEDTNVDDWGYNLLKVDSINASTVVAKINISTASATENATAKLGLSIV